MPFIHVTTAGKPLTQADIRYLQAAMTEIMASIMRKKRDLTAVFIESRDVDGWSVGGNGTTLAAHVAAHVTMGTNTEEEKAAFVKAAMGLLKTALGDGLPVATYVIIYELPAEAWGYDGRTQRQRQAAP